MANTKCVFCDEPMRMGTKSLGVGMNIVTFFCDTCGAVTIHAHENFKRITEFDINFKTKPMTPKPHSAKMTYTRIDAAMDSQMFPQELRSTISSEHCPYEMDSSLENIDMDTYRFAEYNGDDRVGCRGITCDECWAKEYELEPRMKQEKESYDFFVVNGGSDQCMSCGMDGKCGLDCPGFGDRDGCAECLAEISDNDLLYFYLSRRDTFKSIAVVRENLVSRGLEEHVQAIDTAYKYHKAHGAK